MAISFIINSSGKPKKLTAMSQNEINKLASLLSGSVKNINQSEVQVVKNNSTPIKLCDLNTNSLFVLQSTVESFRSNRSNINDLCFEPEETALISALAKCNINVCKAARELGISRDETRGAIKRFNLKWNIDISTFTGLSKACSLISGC